MQSFDLRIEGLELQHELFVADGGDRLAATDRVSFADIEFGDGAADAAASRHDADTLDCREYGLLVGDLTRGHGQHLRMCRCKGAARQREQAQDRQFTHQPIPVIGPSENSTAAGATGKLVIVARFNP